MIIKEFYRTRKDGVNLYKSYSSEGYLIQKVGTDEKYTTAIDVENAPYEYIETDEKVKERPERKKRRETTEEVTEKTTEELGGL